MPFDVDQLLQASLRNLDELVADVGTGPFYGLVIARYVICLNCEQSFQKKLEHYRSRHPEDYTTDEQLTALRANVGDWDELIALNEEPGWDELEEDRWYSAWLNRTNNADLSQMQYTRAMASLLERFRTSDTFRRLTLSPDFKAKFLWPDEEWL